jgi:hypothetical protein
MAINHLHSSSGVRHHRVWHKNAICLYTQLSFLILSHDNSWLLASTLLLPLNQRWTLKVSPILKRFKASVFDLRHQRIGSAFNYSKVLPLSITRPCPRSCTVDADVDRNMCSFHVHIHVHVRVLVHIRVHVHVHLHVHTHVHVPIHVLVHVPFHVYLKVHLNIHLQVRKHVHVDVFVSVHLSVVSNCIIMKCNNSSVGGLPSKFHSEKIPRDGLGTVFVIPRNSVFIKIANFVVPN